MNKLSLFILMLGSAVLAQAPSNYYNAANGFTGLALKSKLKTIITAGHNGHSYNNLFTDPEGFQATDRDWYYENDGSILDMYSEKPNGADAYNYYYNNNDKCGNYNSEADCFNGEHVVPQSTYNSAMPMVGDIHQLLPTDGYVNNRRSNFPFANVSSPSWTSTNGSKLGNVSIAGYSGNAFEPIDEFKGDIARILFYFATRYETQVDSWTSFKMFDGSEGQVFKPSFLQILLTWHNMDPVSPMEIARNNAAYIYQGNRNPYIDNPQYVTNIWGAPLGIEDVALSQSVVYPNPSNTNSVTVSTSAKLTQIQLLNLNGQLVQQIDKPAATDNYTLSNLPSGFYLLRLASDTNVTVKKVIVN